MWKKEDPHVPSPTALSPCCISSREERFSDTLLPSSSSVGKTIRMFHLPSLSTPPFLCFVEAVQCFSFRLRQVFSFQTGFSMSVIYIEHLWWMCAGVDGGCWSQSHSHTFFKFCQGLVVHFGYVRGDSMCSSIVQHQLQWKHVGWYWAWKPEEPDNPWHKVSQLVVHIEWYRKMKNSKHWKMSIQLSNWNNVVSRRFV